MDRSKLNYYFSVLFLGVSFPFTLIFYFSSHQYLIPHVLFFDAIFFGLFYLAKKDKNPLFVSVNLYMAGLTALAVFSTELNLEFGTQYIFLPFSLVPFLLIGNKRKTVTLSLTACAYVFFYSVVFTLKQPNIVYIGMTTVSFVMGAGIVYLYDYHLHKNMAILEGLNLELLKKNNVIEEQATYETEYKVAKKIQEQYLPKQKFDLPNYSIDFIYQPAREISGDFFDFRPIGKNKLAMLLVDVQGKGLEASFVTLRLSSIFRSSISANHGPKEALDILNKELYDISAKNMLSVAYYLELDYDKNTVRYADAGMAVASIVRKNQLIDIKDEGGLPLGAYQKTEYTEGSMKLQFGDSILLSTDGIIDMVNVDKERFGYKNLDYYLSNFKKDHKIDRNLNLKEYMEETIGNYKDTRNHRQDDVAAICIEHLKHDNNQILMLRKEQNAYLSV